MIINSENLKRVRDVLEFKSPQGNPVAFCPQTVLGYSVNVHKGEPYIKITNIGEFHDLHIDCLPQIRQICGTKEFEPADPPSDNT